jgi:hypothetical protein
MNAFFNLAHAARKRVDDRNRLTGHPRCVSENLPHSDLEVQKNAEFLRKIIEIRHGTRIATVFIPAGFETGREHRRTK